MRHLLKPLWITIAVTVAVCLGYYVRSTWPADSPIGRTVIRPARQPLPTPSQDLNGKPLKIAAVLPLSGAKQALGYSILDAIELASADINSTGGVGGRPVEIIPVNGACDSPTAGTNLELTLQTDGVEAIVGGVCSEETLGIADIADSRHILVIAPSGSDDRIAKAGRYVFRLTPPELTTASAQEKYDKIHGNDNVLRPFFDERTPAVQEFFRRYRAHFDADPLPPWYLANAYSSVHAIARLASSRMPPEEWPDALVRDGLDPVGCLPRIEFDRNGDPVWKEFVVNDGTGGKSVDIEVFGIE